MKPQRCYGGTRYLGPDAPGPCLRNVALLDHNARPYIQHCMRRGLRVDLSHFERMKAVLIEDMDRITEEVQQLTGHYINLDSSPQVSELLFKKLGLKQARKKLTKSGDRESVDNEVLVAVQHDHPAVPKILNFKELSKLHGTYVAPMPRLAVKVGHGHWRMFPRLKDTRVPSGRYNCAEPNLLAMPNRTERGRQVCEGFITDNGWVYLSVDECLHPDTMVETLLGPLPISQLVPGDKVLSYDDHRITWGNVTVSRRMQQKRSYRITFDNGESVIASHDHRWPTQWAYTTVGKPKIVLRTTEELRVGERMVPCRQQVAPAGYLHLHADRGSYVSDALHRIVAEAYYGPCPKGHHVHHEDEDKRNNHPDNLVYVLGSRHASDHAKQNYPKQDHNKRIAALREGLKARRSYEGTANPNAKLGGSNYQCIKDLARLGMGTRDLAEIYGISTEYVREIITHDYTSENHRITAIEPIGIQPMWGITVDRSHTYVLSCGVVTHNSQIEPRVVAHRSQDPALNAVYHNEEDIYSDFAISAFRLPDERFKDVDGWHYPGVDKKKHRFPSKTCSLAAIYDVTNIGLLEQMPIVCKNCGVEGAKHGAIACLKFEPLWNENNCQDIINAFYLKYMGIIDMRKVDHARARKYGYVWDDWGRLLHCTGVRSTLEWVVSATLRELGNFPIQATAQGTVKVSQAEVYDLMVEMELFDVAHPVLQVHDELLFEVREDVADELAAMVKQVFENCVRLSVPIKAGAATAATWGQLQK